MLGDYYPEPSANGICCDSLINHFLNQNNQVYVICNKRLGLEKTSRLGDVIVFPVPDFLYQQFAEKKRKSRSGIKKQIYSMLEKVADYTRLIAYAPYYPISSPQRKNNYYKAAKELIITEHINVVISTCMPADAVFASVQLKQEFPNITFVSYFLDPIAGGLNHRLYSKRLAYTLALKKERCVVDASDAVIAQLEHEKHFREEYNTKKLEKIYFLGVPLLFERKSNQRKKENTQTVVYAGAVSRENRNPQFIINLFKHVKNARLIMYITNDPSVAIEAAGDSSNIVIHGRISHDELESVLSDADALLNIGNNQSMQSPSKLVEYISYGKPIISTFRIENDTSAELLEKYPYSLLIDERNSSNLDSVASDIDTFLDTHNEVIPYNVLKQLYRKFSPETVYNIVMGKSSKMHIEQGDL